MIISKHIQQRHRSIKACTLISLVLFFAGCKPVKIIPYVEKKGDTYCVYKITAVQNTGAMHALKTGNIICLYCNGSTNCALYTNQWLHEYISSTDNLPLNQLFVLKDTNISYRLELTNVSTCTNCPGQNKFKIVPER